MVFAKLLKVYNFFGKKEKLKLLQSQLIILITSFFELISVFSVGPLIQILTKPDSIYNEDQFIGKFYNYFEFTSFQSFLFFVVIAVFFILLISTIIITYNTYIITTFTQILGNTLRVNLYKFYIFQPWLYHAKSNTADYISKISAETGRVTNNVIFNVLITNSRLVTGFFIIIFLAIYNLMVSFVVISIIGIMYAVIFWVVKNKIEEYGIVQSTLLRRLFKIMNESFVGIKETIIYGKRKKYLDEFSKIGTEWGLAIGKSQFLQIIPKNILEFLAFSIILFFILVMTLTKELNFNDSLPIIAVYIFAGYKLLPIFQSVYHGIAQLKGNLYALDNISHELSESRKYFFTEENKNMKSLSIENDESIKFNNVSFKYKDQDRSIKDINLNIKNNSLNFIVGPSGAGKSTLLDLILGLIFPKNGEIYVGQNKLTYENSELWHHSLGYVGQNIFLVDDTIKKNICLNDLNATVDQNRLKRALKLSYVDHFLNDMPDGIETIVGDRGIKLSGGQRQRVVMARALYQNKKFLILDEATASLDGIAEKFIIDELKELSKSITIIMVTHNVKLCKYADMIYLLEDGLIKKSGNFDEIKQDSLFVKLLNE